jgi:hypothetical protein
MMKIQNSNATSTRMRTNSTNIKHRYEFNLNNQIVYYYLFLFIMHPRIDMKNWKIPIIANKIHRMPTPDRYITDRKRRTTDDRAMTKLKVLNTKLFSRC